MVIQYNPSLLKGDVGKLEDIQRRFPNKTVVAPNSQLKVPLALTAWPPYARLARAETLTIRNADFIAAARMQEVEPVGEERGVLVHTASVAAFDGQIGQAAYSASKGGIVGMTLPVARDLSAAGIRLNTVAPGLIDTPIYGSGPDSDAFKANLGKNVLFPKRLGEPDELASMVVECLTNSYMNAETIRVDGGIRMPPK